MKATYHNHTPRCKHATGSEEKYLLAAIRNEYDIFGFSDHAPHLWTDALADSRMAPKELPRYVSDIKALRKKYGAKIDVKIGLELEYYPQTHATDMAYYRECGIEYLILGQHTIGNGRPNDHINSFAETDAKEKYTVYVNQCIEAMRTGDFCCFAHPDVFKYRADADFYRQESERLINEAIALKIPLEVNMYGLVDCRHYPNPMFWELVGKTNAEVVIGRDAHSIARVHNDAELQAALRFADKYKLNVVDTIKLPQKL